MKFLRLILTVFVVAGTQGCGASGGFVVNSGSSSDLIMAAKEEIAISRENDSHETACSIYIRNVLKRAGYSVPNFMANDFDKVAAADLEGWTAHAFTADSSDHGRDQLRELLNSKPDHSAFIAQWPRIGNNGHVAIIEKASNNEFVIYQAQQGKATPHSQSTTVEALLYSRNSWGDRGHLRVFTQD